MSRRTSILLAGDHFVLVSLLKQALYAEVHDGIETRELMLPWPDIPYMKIAEVEESSGSEEEMIAALKGVEICVTQLAPLTEKILDASPDLRLFITCRGGPVNVNLVGATRHNVLVCFAPGRNAIATAEQTVGLLLATLRRIPQTHMGLLAGKWQSENYRYENCGMELENAVVGLVGAGAIGIRVANILHSFGCHILIFDPYLSTKNLPPFAEKTDLNELLSRSRIVSLHARVTPETQGMIGAKQLAMMPANSVFINSARGALLNYDALCDAVESGHIWGAGFDVFPEEPLPSHSRLLRLPQIVMTPHLGGASCETAERAAQLCAAEVGHYLCGEPLAHCLNPEASRQSRP